MAAPATSLKAHPRPRHPNPAEKQARVRASTRCSAHRIRPDRPHRPRSRPVFDLQLRQLASDPSVPVEGGSANDYDYCSGDPINCTDLDGTISLPGNKMEQSWCRVPSRLRLCARARNYARGSLRSTYLRYGGVGGDGYADAYQRILWAAMMTIDFGPGTAGGFLGRHERGASGQLAAQRGMDEHNNQLGIELGQRLAREGVDPWDRRVETEAAALARSAGRTLVQGSDARRGAYPY